MNFLLKIYLLLWLLVTLTSVRAQATDSIDVVNEEYKTILFNDKDFIDVLFYKHFNNVLLNNLGPYGSSYYYATNYLQDNRLNVFAPEELKNKLLSMNGFRPFTNLTWINAGRREQILALNHIQKFGKLADFLLTYKRISSPGSYVNQEVNNNDLKSEFNFKTLNTTYSAKIKFDMLRINNQENGGLNSTRDFYQDSIDRRELFKVNINGSYYQSRTLAFGLKQRFNLFSVYNDSVVTKRYFIGLENDVSSTRREYFDFDSNSKIYDTTYFDTTFTQWKDSTHLNTFFNKVSFGVTTTNVELEPYMSFQNYKYHQYLGVDTNFSSNYIGALFSYKRNRLKLIADLNYGINGYNQQDLNGHANFTYLNKDKYFIKLTVNHKLNEPEVYYKSFRSNHFMWDNYQFEKQQITFIGSEFYVNSVDLTLTVNAKLYNNFIYFDTLALPAQQNKQETTSTFMVEKGYKFRNIHFKTALIYQLTSARYILPMPIYVGRQIVYYENRIFKKAMKIRVGFNVSYSSKYYGYEFMPSISQFYAQNKTKIGDYPFVDFFISTHLKRAQIFFKWEHINAGFSNYTYLTTPTTPFLDRSFKFGISWNMFD
ncbi:MAG: putative porin [Flavobacteriales bacterium]